MKPALERRLPGIRFLTQPASLQEMLPRMDIAAFVGFASCGPIHLAVAIEDLEQFENVFGPDAPLAWDAARCERSRSLLGSSVRSFFANGGRRCWVVRVAGPEARANCFPLGGLVTVHFDQSGEPAGIEPAFARARSEGSWSDDVECAAGLRLTGVRVNRIESCGRTVVCPGTVKTAPRPGDLLRLVLKNTDSSFTAFIPVEEVLSGGEVSPPVEGTLLRSTRPLCFQEANAFDLPEGSKARASLYAAQRSCAGTESEDQEPEKERPEYSPCIAATCDVQVKWRSDASHLELQMQIPREYVPKAGTVLRLDVLEESSPVVFSPAGEPWWFTVEGIDYDGSQASGLDESVRILGRAIRRAPGACSSSVTVSRAEVLEFDLQVRSGGKDSDILRRLGFAPGHARYWNDLPTDLNFHDPRLTADRRGKWEQSFEQERRGPGLTARGMRFPLAGMALRNTVFIPLGMKSDLTQFLGCCPSDEEAMTRDGLARFDSSLFLDRNLENVRTSDVVSQADFLRYLSPNPHKLTGIHAALGNEGSDIAEESTLIAVPDAVHRGWESRRQELQKHWWLEISATPPPEKEVRGNFQNCTMESLDAPSFQEGRAPDDNGTFLLRWTAVTSAATYRLEEAAFPDASGAVPVYTDRQPEAALCGRSAGKYFYRVRAERGSLLSPWSATIAVQVGSASGMTMIGAESYSDETLLNVHRALLRMCASRGDLMAVMTLPDHYREDEAVAHAAALADFRTEGALSYGALYHPWLMNRSLEGYLNYYPPDGAACGVLATRGIARGAWIAPANEPLKEVIAAAPRIAVASRQRMQEAQINVVRQDPRGFLILSADTLSKNDADLRPINVRRLLILLRRLALKRGATYVFEPLSDVFLRTVQRGFEAVLKSLFDRGAFAGATPAASYRVVVGPEANSPQSLDRGHFFVELRVAPSQPMKFLTVKLIQAGDRLVAVEAR